MRYKLPIDRSVNRLVPHYLSGRRFILFVQSCLYPLQSLNERFRTFARERHIEARMTSQVIYFEWYLNYKFGKYLKDDRDRIFIRESESIGVDLYHEYAQYQRPCTVWYNGERSRPRTRRNFRVRFTGSPKRNQSTRSVSWSACRRSRYPRGVRLHAVVRGEPL